MKNTNEKGQALLFVIVGLTIALTLAVNVSVRTIASLSRSSKLHTSSRALAAAEAGVERALTVSSYAWSSSLANNTCPVGTKCTDATCPDTLTDRNALACQFVLTGNQDTISSQAIINVTSFRPTQYEFYLKSGEFREINLQNFAGTKVDVCWKSPTVDANYGDLYYILYGGTAASDVEILEKRGLALAGENVSGYDSQGFDLVANTGGIEDYLGCNEIKALPSDNPIGLRLRALGGDVSVGLFSSSALPLQGFEFKSYGRIVQDNNVVATRSINALYTLPYSAVAFDYSFYSGL